MELERIGMFFELQKKFKFEFVLLSLRALLWFGLNGWGWERVLVQRIWSRIFGCWE